MNERLIPFAEFTVAAQADADGVGGTTYVPTAILFTHISHSLVFTGTPTAETIDIQDDGTDIDAARDVSTPGLATLTTPVRIASGSAIECDLNLTAGSTPKATGRIVLWGLVAE